MRFKIYLALHISQRCYSNHRSTIRVAAQARDVHHRAVLHRVLIVTFLGVSWLVAADKINQPPELVLRPNIVLIMADDVGCEVIGSYRESTERYFKDAEPIKPPKKQGGNSDKTVVGHTGYGYERWKTPHIDALTKGGMRFDYCFSMPVCHPTRVCLMTGKYPFRLKSGWGSFPKAEESRTLAQVLKGAGYSTAIAGKWQLCLMKKDTEQPIRMGFDEWSVFGWHEGARFQEPYIYENGRLRTDTKGKYGPELYVDFLGEFMKKSAQAKKPFFAYYSMALAHDVTDDIPTQVPYVPGKDRWMNYSEMVESMDDMVGKLVAKIDRLGLRKKTIILFTGDNGTARRSKLRHIKGRKYEYEDVYSVRNGKRVSGGKGMLLDIGTNVPLIASWPGYIKAGSHDDALVDFSDWLPTLAELGATKVGHKIDGISFAPRLFQLPRNTRKSRSFAFSESKSGKAWVRTQRYKLYNNGQLYDVQKDAMEKKPIKNVTGSLIKEREALQSAFTQIKYPNIK